MNSLSDMMSFDHHPALFLIQIGIKTEFLSLFCLRLNEFGPIFKSPILDISQQQNIFQQDDQFLYCKLIGNSHLQL